ncbi:MAG: Nif3-like dinuclear metal center hexameric protein [Spirochaetes bacterium RIFOXYC1_FULL_54_7]|nr:MAG: Nif3-like dinuclear metal center hexameric protein [Spirochaetes bacterium RIFOXYC1_FULL_54_7]
MDIQEFESWASGLLDIAAFGKVDDSLNGLQVGRSDGALRKLAFAVDASLETIRRAKEAGAQALFVHHGLFWGKPLPVTGNLLARLSVLLEADMALYACHLPLDAHAELGNNAVLARMLGLKDIQPFGEYHGIKIGFKGILDPSLDLGAVVRKVLPAGDQARTILPFGPQSIAKVAVVSGGAPFELLQAAAEGQDLYITGEPSHSIYHEAAESRINFIAAGHYATEVHGVKAVAERVSRDLGLETVFIEQPTGL